MTDTRGFRDDGTHVDTGVARDPQGFDRYGKHISESTRTRGLRQPREANGQFTEKLGSAPETELNNPALEGTEKIPAGQLLESPPEALVDEYGNALFVTGEVYRSSTVPGMLAVETPFGTLYVGEDADIRVRY